MFLVAIWLHGIYLPLHGFACTETPFLAGVYMLRMLIGTMVMGPIGGNLTDKYGARLFATLGIIIVTVSLFALTMLPYNFSLVTFEIILFINGLGNGLFSAPNTTAIMNSLKSIERGAGNGMRQTFNNIGSTISMAMFFTITVFTIYLPSQMYTSAISLGLPVQIAAFLSRLSPSGLLFAAFLGIDPASALLANLVSSLPAGAISILDSHVFLPSFIEPAFMIGLRFSIYLSVALVLTGAISSYMRGKKYVIE